MKILQRDKFRNPIAVAPGDYVQLSYKRDYVDEKSGKLLKTTNEVVMYEPVTKAGVFTEGVIFEVEPGDFEGATGGLGGAFLET